VAEVARQAKVGKLRSLRNLIAMTFPLTGELQSNVPSISNSEESKLITRLLWGGLLGLLAGFGITMVGGHSSHSAVGPFGASASDRHRIQDAIRQAAPGDQFEEWIMVYIGSSSCTHSNHPDLPDALAGIRATLEGELSDHAAHVLVSAIGVDLNPLAGRELDHLRWAGSFEQVSLGGSYLNWVASHVSWYPSDGAPGVPTPQVVLVRRSLERLNERGTGMQVALRDERLVGRRYGLHRLQSWDLVRLVEVSR